MGTHNIFLYKEVDKKYTDCNLKTIELLIMKTCLFKYTEKLITETLKIFRQKIQIFFIFLLKT